MIPTAARRRGSAISYVQRRVRCRPKCAAKRRRSNLAALNLSHSF